MSDPEPEERVTMAAEPPGGVIVEEAMPDPFSEEVNWGSDSAGEESAGPTPQAAASSGGMTPTASQRAGSSGGMTPTAPDPQTRGSCKRTGPASRSELAQRTQASRGAPQLAQTPKRMPRGPSRVVTSGGMTPTPRTLVTVYTCGWNNLKWTAFGKRHGELFHFHGKPPSAVMQDRLNEAALLHTL